MFIIGIILAFVVDERFLILYFGSFIPLVVSAFGFRPDANLDDVLDGKAQ